MDAALSVMGSLLRTDPPQNIIDVIRHIKATLNAVKDKTVDRMLLLRKVVPMLPDSFRSSAITLLQNEDLFEHIWDDIRMPKNNCFCF